MKQTQKTERVPMNRIPSTHTHLTDRQIMICADPGTANEEKQMLLAQCAQCPECTDRILTVVRAGKASARGKQKKAPFERAVFAVAQRKRSRARMQRILLAAASFTVIAGAGIFLLTLPGVKNDPLALQVSDNKGVINAMATETSKRKKSSAASSLKRPAADAGYSFFLLRNGASYSKSIEESVVAGISAQTHTVQSSADLKIKDYDTIIRAVDALPEQTRNDFRDGYLTGLLTHAVTAGTFEGEKRKELTELMLRSSSEDYRKLGKRIKEGDAAAVEDLRKMMEDGKQ